mgnify:CR=1 FL=1
MTRRKLKVRDRIVFNIQTDKIRFAFKTICNNFNQIHTEEKVTW